MVSRIGFVLCCPLVLVFGSLEALESGAEPVAGFQACDRLEFSPNDVVGGLLYTPEGALVTYVGSQVLLHDGNSTVTLTSLDSPVFGAFAVLSPERDAVVFGESSEGNVYSVPLSGGGRTLLDNVPFNYDLVFDQTGRGLVSTTTSLGGAQRIVLLDDDPMGPLQSVIENIPGFSGPMAVDDEGNFYYGTADLMSETGQSLVRFSKGQIQTAVEQGPIDFSLGEVVLSEIGGFSDMLWHDGAVYFTDLGFASGLGTLQRIDARANYAVSVVAGFPSRGAFTSPTLFDLRPGRREFVAGVGEDGGTLVVAYADFATINKVAEITPQLFFVRGEVNGDGEVDLSDVIAVLNYLFLGGSTPDPLEAADVNADAEIEIGDVVYLLNFLFRFGPDIPLPYPDPGPESF